MLKKNKYIFTNTINDKTYCLKNEFLNILGRTVTNKKIRF